MGPLNYSHDFEKNENEDIQKKMKMKFAIDFK